MDNISEFIYNNRKQAQVYAIEAQEYLKKNNIPPFKTKSELASYLSANKINIDPNKLESVWIGNQILQALSSSLPARQEEMSQETISQGGVANLAGMAFLPLAFFNRGRRPELMEDDPGFKKTEEDLKKEWQKNNPGKDFQSREGIDYLHGNLDNPDAPTLRGDAEKAFREKNPKQAAKYDVRAKKIYKNHEDDPSVRRAKTNIDEHIKARGADFEKKIKDFEWDRFAKKYPEKAKAYRSKIADVNSALDRHEVRQHPMPIGQIYVPHQKPLGAAPVRSAPKGFGSRKGGLMDGLNRLPSMFGGMGRAEQAAERTAIRVLGFFARLSPIGWAGIGLLVIFILALFIILFNPGNLSVPGLGGGGGSGSESVPPGGTPGTTSRGLDYYIPFRDSSVLPADLKNYYAGLYPNSQIQNWDTIISQYITNGWNPAFVLTLWIEETHAQTPPYDDALGCDPSHPTENVDISLACLFDVKNFGALTNDQFADFMCRYGGDRPTAPCSFTNTNPNFPPNIKDVYSKLVPSGPGALVLVTPPSPGSVSATCPIRGSAIVTCGSAENERGNPLCGHCNEEYQLENPNLCNYEEIYYAEDIAGRAGQEVFFPSVNAEALDWIKVSEYGTASGIGYIIEYKGTSPTGKLYWLRFHHVNQGSGVSSGKSGDVGARICTTSPKCHHVHVEFASLGTGGRIPIDAPTSFCI